MNALIIFVLRTGMVLELERRNPDYTLCDLGSIRRISFLVSKIGKLILGSQSWSQAKQDSAAGPGSHAVGNSVPELRKAGTPSLL